MDGRILDLREYLLDQLNLDWTVEKMANKAGISLSHFPVAFGRVLKNTPAAWLKERRLEKAIHLIETTYDHIDQISLRIGMQDPSHFARNFKDKYGLSPTEYRDQFHENRLAELEKG